MQASGIRQNLLLSLQQKHGHDRNLFVVSNTQQIPPNVTVYLTAAIEQKVHILKKQARQIYSWPCIPYRMTSSLRRKKVVAPQQNQALYLQNKPTAS